MFGYRSTRIVRMVRTLDASLEVPEDQRDVGDLISPRGRALAVDLMVKERCWYQFTDFRPICFGFRATRILR